MAKSKGYTSEQKNEMKVAYEGGTRLKPLAEKYQVSVPTMAKYVREAGGTLRNAGTPKKVTTELWSGDHPTQAELDRGLARQQAEINTPQAPVARRILPFE